MLSPSGPDQNWTRMVLPLNGLPCATAPPTPDDAMMDAIAALLRPSAAKRVPNSRREILRSAKSCKRSSMQALVFMFLLPIIVSRLVPCRTGGPRDQRSDHEELLGNCAERLAATVGDQ